MVVVMKMMIVNYVI